MYLLAHVFTQIHLRKYQIFGLLNKNIKKEELMLHIKINLEELYQYDHSNKFHFKTIIKIIIIFIFIVFFKILKFI